MSSHETDQAPSPRPHATKRVAVTMFVLLLAGCGGRTVTLDAARGLAAAEVAEPADGNNLYVTAVDGRPLDKTGNAGTPLSTALLGPLGATDTLNTYRLPPGRHRVAVRYEREEVGRVINTVHVSRAIGRNRWSFAHDFRPGRRYTPGSIEYGPIPVAVLLEVEGEGATARQRVVALPELPDAPPPADVGADGDGDEDRGAVVRGIGYVDGRHAGGRPVLLVPAEDRADVAAWAEKQRAWFEKNGVMRRGWSGRPRPPAAVRRPVAQALGYGTGQFVLRGVPPGRYVVIWDPDSPVLGDVTVPAGASDAGPVYIGGTAAEHRAAVDRWRSLLAVLQNRHAPLFDRPPAAGHSSRSSAKSSSP